MKLLTNIAFTLMLFSSSAIARPKFSGANRGIFSRVLPDTSVLARSRIDSAVFSSPPSNEDVFRAGTINSLLEHVGTRVIYCTFFYSGKYLKDLDVTVLYLGGNYPNQILTLLIEGKNRNKFKTPPEIKYLNTGVCIKGILQNNKGNPQIIITDPGQIEVVHKSLYPIN